MSQAVKEQQQSQKAYYSSQYHLIALVSQVYFTLQALTLDAASKRSSETV